MAQLDTEQQDIDTMVEFGVERETATRFRAYLVANGKSSNKEISKIVEWISPLLRSGFTLHEIITPKE